MPMVELVGKKHIIRINNPIYVLNRHDDLENESKEHLESQKESDGLIRLLPPRKRLEFKFKKLKLFLNILSVGNADWKGFISPIFLAISANLACISSDGKYGMKRALSSDW